MDEWKLSSIASVAPTLADLKSLSIEQQSQLLLRRLLTRYGVQSFGKMNFNLSEYARDLYAGFASNESGSVKDFLLGAPWKYLENHGLIRDNGQGFL